MVCDGLMNLARSVMFCGILCCFAEFCDFEKLFQSYLDELLGLFTTFDDFRLALGLITQLLCCRVCNPLARSAGIFFMMFYDV